jgi:hypothetical protein
VGQVVGELGLRYPASHHIDPAAHAERLALLCEDLADVPIKALEWAADEWAKTSAFLPKASDIRALARRYAEVGGKQIPTDLDEYCAAMNKRWIGRWYSVVGEGKDRRIIDEAVDVETWRARRAGAAAAARDESKPHPMNDYGRVPS